MRDYILNLINVLASKAKSESGTVAKSILLDIEMLSKILIDNPEEK